MRRLWVLTLLLAACWLAAPVGAQENRDLAWRRYDVALDVQRDGRVLVSETQEVEYLSGTWTNGARSIPRSRIGSLSGVDVFEIVGQTERRLPSEETEEAGERAVSWRYAPAAAGDIRTFRLRYTVEGVIRGYPDNQQIRWIAVPPDRTFPVRQSTVTLTLPGGGEPQVLASYPEKLGGDETANADGATFRVGDVPAGDGFEVRAQFPAGTVDAPAPAWQAKADRLDYLNETVKPRNNALLLAAGLLIGSLSLVALIVTWRTKGREPQLRPDTTRYTFPPSDLPAPVVGVLLDERADVQDAVSALFSLAERGFARITEIPAMDGEPNFQLDLLGSPEQEELRPYERILVEKLFDAERSVLLSEVKARLPKAVPGFRTALYEEVAHAGLFKANPEKVRKRYRLYGIGVFMLGMLALCASIPTGFFFVASSYVDVFYVLIPGFSIFALGMGLTVLAYAMPVRTTTGSVAAAQWRSFRSYLADIEKSPDFDQDPGVLKRYLSYAVAFGLGKSWVDKFAAGDIQGPAWYGNTASAGVLWSSDRTTPASSGASSAGSSVSGSDISGLGTFLDQASSAFSSGFSSGSSGGFSGGGSGGSAGFS
ncbi:MAG: DUF2207 domain-containing protein [Chloroflexota bacterium]|nr:DUF2207 domain-containing protein [Chloroflexota bacterium]